MKYLGRPLRIRLLVILLGLLIILLATWLYFWMTMPPRDIGSAREITRSNIIAVLEAAQQYHERNGSWPDPHNWTSALRDSLADPAQRRVLEGKSNDGWGTPLQCAITGMEPNNEYHCMSFGPNKADDHETGDDIVGVAKKESLRITHQ